MRRRPLSVGLDVPDLKIRILAVDALDHLEGPGLKTVRVYGQGIK
jgi:hypothetical protein